MRYLPSEVRNILRSNLPGFPHIKVIARTEQEKVCPAYMAEHYEIVAFHYSSIGAPLDALAAAMSRLPGVYATLIISADGWSDPTWPVRYRSPETLRPSPRSATASTFSPPSRG